MESFTIISISCSVRLSQKQVRFMCRINTKHFFIWLHCMKFLRRDTEIIYVNQTGFHSMFNYVTILVTEGVYQSTCVFNLQK